MKRILPALMLASLPVTFLLMTKAMRTEFCVHTLLPESKPAVETTEAPVRTASPNIALAP